jgi:hypothetical protein
MSRRRLPSLPTDSASIPAFSNGARLGATCAACAAVAIAPALASAQQQPVLHAEVVVPLQVVVLPSAPKLQAVTPLADRAAGLRSARAGVSVDEAAPYEVQVSLGAGGSAVLDEYGASLFVRARDGRQRRVAMGDAVSLGAGAGHAELPLDYEVRGGARKAPLPVRFEVTAQRDEGVVRWIVDTVLR